MTAIADPWAELAARPRVTLRWAALGGHVRGATDGIDTIWLDPSLSQRERRCTLAHELTHLDLGHRGPQPPPVEAHVRDVTARWLLPDLALVGAALADQCPADAASDLWVTDTVLADRLAHLDAPERASLRRHLPAWT